MMSTSKISAINDQSEYPASIPPGGVPVADREALAGRWDRVGTIRGKNTNGLQSLVCSPLNSVARPEGLEPPTYGFEVRRSIQLSYGRIIWGE